jgi:uncharacterized protein involved in propanediol utilization
VREFEGYAGLDEGPGRAAVGRGSAAQHHGELMQGALWRAGEWVSCLITMPGRGLGSSACFRAQVAESGDGERELAAVDGAAAAGVGGAAVAVAALEVVPAWKQKAARAACLTLARLGLPVEGRLEVECSVATGVGLGSSTSDVVAAIRAVAAACGVSLDAGTVARLAIEAEGASDPIMFDGEMLLFAQRQGRVLESFGAWIPRFAVMSFDADPASGGVDTLSLPVPDYTSDELTAFEHMVARVRTAFGQRDSGALANLAAIATESATLNQRFLRLRNFERVRRLAEEFGALGLQISHSGTIGGLLFEPGWARAEVTLEERIAARLCSFGARPLGMFTTGD